MSVIYRVDYTPRRKKDRLRALFPVMDFDTEEGANKVRKALLEADPDGECRLFRITHEEVEIP